MKIRFHNNFERQYRKLMHNAQSQVRKRLVLFSQDEFNPILNNHPLSGKYKGYRSVNITGDIRALYKYQNPSICIFVIIDSHSNLYK
ncbi:MAG: type II toxin-antitoxin system mRNA interferase toxin, RelE/StbE family [Candidatus Nealsonbacteria bacterium]